MKANPSSSTYKDLISNYKSHKDKTLDLSNMCLYIEDMYSNFQNTWLEQKPEYWMQRSEKLKECGSFLQFAFDADDLDYNVLVNANFCKYRLCPACNWRKSLKSYSESKRVISFISDKEKMEKYGLTPSKYQYIMATFTIKNVKDHELSDAIDRLMYGYTYSFMRRKEVKKCIAGSIRSLEVTYNSRNSDFHPHIHAIFVVDQDYFGKNYISFDDFRKYAADAFKCEDYLPEIRIKKIDDSEIDNAVCEVTKYVCKGDTYLSDLKNNESFDNKVYPFVVLDKCLAHRRLISYNGLFKKVRNLLRDQEIISNDEDLVNIDGQKIEENRNLYVLSTRYDMYLQNYKDVNVIKYEDWKEIYDLQLKNFKITSLMQKLKVESILSHISNCYDILDKIFELDPDAAKVCSISSLGFDRYAEPKKKKRLEKLQT